MAIKPLTLATLSQIEDGKVAVAVDTLLRRASLDCHDRPGDPKERTVVIKIGLIPVLQPDGGCSEVKAQINAKAHVPDLKTREFSLGLKHNGTLVFNEDSLDSIDQATFPMGEDE
jgi:hypothetical protein